MTLVRSFQLLTVHPHLQLVPVRSIKVCQFPDTSVGQGVQDHSRHDHGEGGVRAQVRVLRVRRRPPHLSRHVTLSLWKQPGTGFNYSSILRYS
jgi:hypothetical protein